MLAVVTNTFVPEADTDISKVSFRERRQGLKEDMISYLAAKSALFYLSCPNNPDFTTLTDVTIADMATKVIRSFVRRAEPADQNILGEVSVRSVEREKQAYTGGYSKSTNLDGLTTNYEKTQRKNLATDESEPLEIDALNKTRKCYNCNIKGHLAKTAGKRSNYSEKVLGSTQDNQTDVN